MKLEIKCLSLILEFEKIHLGYYHLWTHSKVPLILSVSSFSLESTLFPVSPSFSHSSNSETFSAANVFLFAKHGWEMKNSEFSAMLNES